jgi:hypothetical protein
MDKQKPTKEGNKNVAVHLMIKTQKFTSNVQSVPRHPPDIYRRFTLTPSVIPNSNYVIMVIEAV